MRIPASSFHPASITTRHSANLELSWLDAADDADDAYIAWRDSDHADQQIAYVVYRAALDREEAA
jgi:hypothetical protein